jgi:uncharacterized OsmC-like protein
MMDQVKTISEMKLKFKSIHKTLTVRKRRRKKAQRFKSRHLIWRVITAMARKKLR